MPKVSRALTSWALQRRRSSSTPPWNDRVDALAGRAVLLVPGEAAVQPPVRALGGARRVVARDVEREALVEDQRDVGVQRALHGHARLRPEELLRSVDVGAEAHALLVDGEDRAAALGVRVAALDLVRDGPVAHREHLEAAGVGDHRAVPAHEAVDAAEALHQLGPRGEEEVERVRQHHVVAERRRLLHLERLDDGLGGEGDERRRAHVAVGEVQGAGARA